MAGFGRQLARIAHSVGNIAVIVSGFDSQRPLQTSIDCFIDSTKILEFEANFLCCARVVKETQSLRPSPVVQLLARDFV
jgi:hypothetical protein